MDDISSSLQNIVKKISSLKEIGCNKNLAKFGDSVVNMVYSLAKSIASGKLDQRKVSRKILSTSLKNAGLKPYAKARSDAHDLADTAEGFIGYMYCAESWSIESMAEILLEKLKNFNLNDFTQENFGAIEAFSHLLLKIKEHLIIKFKM